MNTRHAPTPSRLLAVNDALKCGINVAELDVAIQLADPAMGQAPEALYWVAQATLPNGDRILARLRFAVALEDVCVETVQDLTHPPAMNELVVGAPVHPKIEH
jgi:hypothetical protein